MAVGDALREARTRRGLTVDQVARETSIPARYLAALEASDYAAFPTPESVPGSIHAYAAYLGLDPSALVAEYEREREDGAAEARTVIYDAVPGVSGQAFGRYEIRRELGHGGMGSVYAAWDPRFRREVAVKVLSRQLLASPDSRERFDREARAAAGLEHAAIVPVHDYGEERGEPYIVFRLMGGGSLADRIRAATLGAGDVVALTRRIASALDYAHANGVVHRDVKPGNVLFDGQGEAWLGDFGIARVAGQSGTLTGMGVIGSPNYMSPEQAMGLAATPASDVYSLGATVYEALAGRPPFEAEHPLGVLHKLTHEDPPPLRSLRPDVPPALAEAVARSMAREPAQRFPSASSFAAALSAAAAGASASGEPPAAAGFRTEVATPPGSSSGPSAPAPASMSPPLPAAWETPPSATPLRTPPPVTPPPIATPPPPSPVRAPPPSPTPAPPAPPPARPPTPVAERHAGPAPVDAPVGREPASPKWAVGCVVVLLALGALVIYVIATNIHISDDDDSSPGKAPSDVATTVSDSGVPPAPPLGPRSSPQAGANAATSTSGKSIALVFNASTAKQLADPRVRDALTASTHTFAIVWFDNRGVPLPAQTAGFDPARAKKLLQEAGVDPASLKLALMTDSTKTDPLQLSVLLAEWSTNVGVPATIEAVDSSTYVRRIASGEFQVRVQ